MNQRLEQQVAGALSVKWDGALEEAVRRRIDARLARRARRQGWSLRAAVVLLLSGAAGLVIASMAGAGPWRDRGASRKSIAATPPVVSVARPAPAAASSPTVTGAPHPVRSERRAPARKASPGAVDPVEALLERADRARLTGHPSEAVAPLSEIMSRYPVDPRASLAAFQLGRVLADDLDDPARAAQAFDRARALAPAGPLESEARARADEARRAATARSGRAP